MVASGSLIVFIITVFGLGFDGKRLITNPLHTEWQEKIGKRYIKQWIDENNEYFIEIDKDINRLNIITQRFSKIGSIPTLETRDFIEESLNSINYLIARTSKNIEFNLDVPDFKIPVKLDPTLYSWTIENLIKNGIDAMKGKGKIDICISKVKNKAVIHITDSGKGIPKSDFEKIFNPGFTTKKRGWGLGLSLTKRIIEEYHDGKIKVVQSQINKGTTMQITLNRL